MLLRQMLSRGERSPDEADPAARCPKCRMKLVPREKYRVGNPLRRHCSWSDNIWPTLLDGIGVKTEERGLPGPVMRGELYAGVGPQVPVNFAWILLVVWALLTKRVGWQPLKPPNHRPAPAQARPPRLRRVPAVRCPARSPARWAPAPAMNFPTPRATLRLLLPLPPIAPQA